MSGMQSLRNHQRWLWIAATLLVLTPLYLAGPIAQPTEYHDFADQRPLLGISNGLDVLSNAGFLITGLLGLQALYRQQLQIAPSLRPAAWLLFTGVSLVAVGSGYYHLQPDNGSLVWDRLPMAIGFMALFCIVVGEYVSLPLANRLLWPLVCVGLGATLYWHYTEQAGVGDLRPYLLVQFVPMVIIPVLLLSRRGLYNRQHGYWQLLLCYLAAKLLEYADQPVFELLGFVSGHSLKHLAAAVGIFLLYRSYRHRTPLQQQ